MLTDTQLKNIKATGKLFKVADRDGLYIAVTKTGQISFRYDYRLNGRRETIVLGKYGPDGISLSEAREKLIASKKEIFGGKSPAREKQRSLQKTRAAKTFGEFTKLWLNEYSMAESTKAMRKAIIDRDIEPQFGKFLLGDHPGGPESVLREGENHSKCACDSDSHTRSGQPGVQICKGTGPEGSQSCGRCEGIVHSDLQAEGQGVIA